MKKLTKEILIIILISSVLALAYNFFSSKPLPWLHEEIKIETVDDSLLIFDSDSSLISMPDTLGPRNAYTPTKDSTIVKTEVKDSLFKLTEKPVKVTPEKTDEKIEGSVKTLTFEQVIKNQTNPNFLFIDARPEHEWEEAHIGNAINILPPYDGDMDSYFKKIMALPKDKIIVVYCSGGSCESSHKVAGDLLSFGYPKVFLYSGGWDEWTKRRGK